MPRATASACRTRAHASTTRDVVHSLLHNTLTHGKAHNVARGRMRSARGPAPRALPYTPLAHPHEPIRLASPRIDPDWQPPAWQICVPAQFYGQPGPRIPVLLLAGRDGVSGARGTETAAGVSTRDARLALLPAPPPPPIALCSAAPLRPSRAARRRDGCRAGVTI